MRSLDPDSQSGSRSRRSADCWTFAFEGFSCSLEVLHGGLGINKLQFLILYVKWHFSQKFLSWIRFRIRIRIDLNCLVWIRIRTETKADSRHCFSHTCIKALNTRTGNFLHRPIKFFAIISFPSLKTVRNFIRFFIFLAERFFGVIIKTVKKSRQNFNQCWGSVTFWCGSGSPDPFLWLMDPDPDPTPDPTTFFSDFKD
jgi:hypothetical protein